MINIACQIKYSTTFESAPCNGSWKTLHYSCFYLIKGNLFP